jgi:hypothetical protein
MHPTRKNDASTDDLAGVVCRCEVEPQLLTPAASMPCLQTQTCPFFREQADRLEPINGQLPGKQLAMV